MSAQKTYTAFFYGTLLHPAILRRVIGHQGADLKICPALLLVSYTYLKIVISPFVTVSHSYDHGCLHFRNTLDIKFK